MKLEDKLGRRIRSLRNDQNLTQESLSEKAGLGTITVRRMEQGLSLTLPNLESVSNAFGIPLHELLRFDNEPLELSHPRLGRLFEQLDDSSEEVIALVCDVVEAMHQHLREPADWRK